MNFLSQILNFHFKKFFSVCSKLNPSKFNIILDLQWNYDPQVRHLANALEVPYFKLDATIFPLLEPSIKFIRGRNGTESVFIFPREELIDQVVSGFMESSQIRVLFLNQLNRKNAEILEKKRPLPEFNTIVGTTEEINQIFGQVDTPSS